MVDGAQILSRVIGADQVKYGNVTCRCWTATIMSAIMRHDDVRYEAVVIEIGDGAASFTLSNQNNLFLIDPVQRLDLFQCESDLFDAH